MERNNDISCTYFGDFELKHTRIGKSWIFLDLKIKLIDNIKLISAYDKKLYFDFKVNNLTSWYSCIKDKVLKNILFLQIARIKRICQNSNSLDLVFHNLVETVKSNSYPSRILSVTCNY